MVGVLEAVVAGLIVLVVDRLWSRGERAARGSAERDARKNVDDRRSGPV